MISHYPVTFGGHRHRGSRRAGMWYITKYRGMFLVSEEQDFKCSLNSAIIIYLKKNMACHGHMHQISQ